MPPLHLIKHRLRVHGLAGTPFTTPEDVVRWLGAIQAQEYAVAKWSVGQRARDVDDSRMDQAIADGTILRTHVLRPTWHFVLPADIRWMQQLTAPRVRALLASYDRKLELDGKVLARSHSTITVALDGGRHLTRSEIAGALRHAGIETNTQRLAHLIMHAELDALVCSGTPRGNQRTYALLDRRADPTPPLERDEALVELATRYFASRGPATIRDFRWWSSLTATDAKRAVEAAGGRLQRLNRDDRSYWLATSPAPQRPRRSPAAHLLQAYDELIVGYTESRDVLPIAAGARPATAIGANVLHTVVLHDKVVGHWRRVVRAKSVEVELRIPVRLDRAGKNAIGKAVERYRRFAGKVASTRAASVRVP